MPLQLTTPIGVGDLDPGAPAAEYTHCKIRLDGNDPDEQIIPISISYHHGKISNIGTFINYMLSIFNVICIRTD